MPFDFQFSPRSLQPLPWQGRKLPRDPVSHPLPPQRVSCSPSIWIALLEVRMGPTEVVPTAVATTLFYSLETAFTTWCQSLQSQLAQIRLQAGGFQFLTCSVPATDAISAVCKSRHWHIYFYVSSCMQDIGFWKIVRCPNVLPSGMMRRKFSVGLNIYLWFPLRG